MMHEMAIGQRVQVIAPWSNADGMFGHVEGRITGRLWQIKFDNGRIGYFEVQALLLVYSGAEVVEAMVDQANPPPADPPSPWVTVLVDDVAVEAVNVLIDLVRYALTDKPARPTITEEVQ